MVLKRFKEGKGPLRKVLKERMRKGPILKRLREEFFKATTKVYDTDSFYEALRHDLKEAKDLIVIISPFLNQKRVHKFTSLPEVKGVLERDVPMIVVTRPAEKGQVSGVKMHRACIDMLRESGIKVVTMGEPKLHFKSVVIDNAIIYLGSINPLSILTEWEIPADYMMRFESEALVDEIIENAIGREIYERWLSR